MMNNTTIGDLNIHYHEQGKGTPIILVHGLGSDNTVWDNLIHHISGKYRIISLDLRGHGMSSKTPGPYSIELFSNDLVQFLKSLGINRAHFFGHSMGGAIIQNLAIKYPEIISSLSIISSFAYVDPRLKEIFLELLQVVKKRGYEAFFDRCLELANTPQFVKDNQKLFQNFRDQRKPLISLNSIEDTIQACLETDIINSLDQITSPTMVIAGSRDIFTQPYHSETIKMKINGSNMHIIEGAPHNLLVEQPEETSNILNKFLEGL